MWRRLGMRLLDLLYPPSCELCEQPLSEGRALCGECDAELPRLCAPFCDSCGQPFDGQVGRMVDCPNCRDVNFAFEFARPAMRRDERTLDLVHRLKYRREIHLADELGRLAHESFQDPRLEEALDGCWPLVPVPLHRQRLRRRHFNQAAEIVRAMASHGGLPVLPALRRCRSTQTQTALGRKQRLANLRGAFEVTRKGKCWLEKHPKAGVVLVDDVLTTGSTAHECARTLRRAGFARVVVITVMRG